jgi:hypothetical protein
MTQAYTIVTAARRPIKGPPDLWDIIETKMFKDPNGFLRYVKHNLGFLRTRGTKIEMYEGCKLHGCVDHKPMIVKFGTPEGTFRARPCVQLTNGNLQDIRDFAKHWRQLLKAVGI